MYISNLSLTNFRGTKSISINFNKQLNILIGSNGSGKSTICDSIDILMSCFRNQLKSIEQCDIRKGEITANLEITTNDKFKWSVSSDKKTKRLKFNEFTFFFYYNTNNFTNTLFQLPYKLNNKKVENAVQQFINNFIDLNINNNSFEKNNKLFIINELSEGEQCLIAMISDIIHNIVISNPFYDNPLESESVIVIDNIDLHLYPLWQRIIIPQLLKILPNCQFIVSTRSPLIVNETQPGNIFILNNKDEIEYYHLLDSSEHPSKWMLENIAGLKFLNTSRPDELYNTLEMIYDHIDKGNLSNAKNKITKLLQTLE